MCCRECLGSGARFLRVKLVEHQMKHGLDEMLHQFDGLRRDAGKCLGEGVTVARGRRRVLVIKRRREIGALQKTANLG